MKITRNHIKVIQAIHFSFSLLKVPIEIIEDVMDWVCGRKAEITHEHIRDLQTVYMMLDALGAETKELEEVIADLKETGSE